MKHLLSILIFFSFMSVASAEKLNLKLYCKGTMKVSNGNYGNSIIDWDDIINIVDGKYTSLPLRITDKGFHFSSLDHTDNSAYYFHINRLTGKLFESKVFFYNDDASWSVSATCEKQDLNQLF